MAWICKFVDAVSASPTTLLDLNNADSVSSRNLAGTIQAFTLRAPGSLAICSSVTNPSAGTAGSASPERSGTR